MARTKRTTIRELARQADPDYDKPQAVYTFSNGRQFYEKPKRNIVK